MLYCHVSSSSVQGELQCRIASVLVLCRLPRCCTTSCRTRRFQAQVSTRQQFWIGAEAVITDLAPKNKALLAVRDEIQGKVDAWHGEHAGPDYDKAAYKAFLKEIGYLLDKPADFSISTSGVSSQFERFRQQTLTVR